ncbi:hypothetical protein ONE63_000375 [Megalurothrips usitatus]|uniref:EamA domain-containing protein n=1 Tax=Megalurothrips usitatus TaxID=439358 RepID=A0AAV7Y198_9NEOP|nr:hypothetical protein ONE63_000375 [Megalurothrips usitatus]
MERHAVTAPFAGYAALSGAAAASASVFGKLYSSADQLWWGAVLIVCMVVTNGLVWTFFVRALRSSKTSLSVTVTSTAVNYCCSAVFGWLMFSERTSVLWWTGAMLVVTGLILINSSDSSTIPEAEREGAKED